jgi:hypothetical protein
MRPRPGSTVDQMATSLCFISQLLDKSEERGIRCCEEEVVGYG